MAKTSRWNISRDMGMTERNVAVHSTCYVRDIFSNSAICVCQISHEEKSIGRSEYSRGMAACTWEKKGNEAGRIQSMQPDQRDE